MTASRLGKYIAIPTPLADKYRRQEELARLRRAKYEDKRKASGYVGKHAPAPFVFWDGETPHDAGYALFGNSHGYEICHPFLSTVECLELILECETDMPNAIHIAFGFNLDVSYILKDLSWRHLNALHDYGRTIWGEYEIEHIPHKWFMVKHGKTRAKIYDIRSFFAGDYVSCLREFTIGSDDTLEIIKAGKKTRDEFVWANIADIRKYWLHEISLGPLLADKLRDIFFDAGYSPRSWHGPGALARMALSRHHVYDAMAETPVDVRLAAQYAFAGGRFELFRAGHTKSTVYCADIHSAYPHFATHLPNLARGKWRYARSFEPGRFGVWHINYRAKPDSWRPYPLFRRMPNGMVVWPYRTEGWYWAPEAELVAKDKAATFIEGWVFDEDDPTDRPFAFLAEYYAKRRRLKNAGSAAEYTFKLIINSVYGQLAQRAGWDRKHRNAPKSHQLEWAGYITSACRAAVYRVALRVGDKLVSIDTDGVMALGPFDGIDSGNALGQWDLTEYRDGIFWQSGIYTLKPDLGYGEDYDDWTKAKTRGIPKGSYTADDLLSCLATRTPLTLAKKVFVTYGLASTGRQEEWNTWKLEPHEFSFGGDGKRVHVERCCKTRCSGDLHVLAGIQLWYMGDPSSKRHYLPWVMEPTPEQATMDDLTLWDADHLDSDDEWVRTVDVA